MIAAEGIDVRAAISAARMAQSDWAQQSARARAKVIGALRPIMAERAEELAQLAGEIGQRPPAEKMVSEILPLLEACRFLERKASRILRDRRCGWRGRPLWLHGSSFVIRRNPFGVVLIVGPANYPFFIPMAQTLQALVAGNAVALKPALGTTALLELFFQCARDVIPTQLVQILPEKIEAARAAVAAGIDKAFFTGSSENGRDFLQHLAARNIPSVMELSGADPVFVRADADLALAAKAITFGRRLNGGNTCMAPQAIISHALVATELERALGEKVIAVRDDAHALEIAALSEHGLGASVFSRDEKAAQAFARQLPTGFVTINDLIVPTADPRFPFCGVRGSGFGVTRGAEGLLEMTYPQTIALRRARFHPHLDEPQVGDAKFFAAFIALVHSGGFKKRARAFIELVRAARARNR